jgi:sporulation protein YqfC
MRKSLKSSHEKFKKEARNTLYQGLDRKKKKRSEPRASCMEEISKALNLPADILAGAPIITATGRNEICLENYKGIIEYNGNLIKVQTKVCKICIEGKKLNILYFNEDEMRITGLIQAIYYQ